jgi:Rrf2 family protein
MDRPRSPRTTAAEKNHNQNGLTNFARYGTISISLVMIGCEMVSQKCQYALRALFELAKRFGQGPVKVSEIAETQAIPPRFLEVILTQLKQAGFVDSRRGNEGGYVLMRSPRALTVGEVMRFVEGPIGPVGCAEGPAEANCRMYGSCVFLPMWDRVRRAVSDIYDDTTFQNLIEQEARMCGALTATYSI